MSGMTAMIAYLKAASATIAPSDETGFQAACDAATGWSNNNDTDVATLQTDVTTLSSSVSALAVSVAAIEATLSANATVISEAKLGKTVGLEYSKSTL